MENRKGMYGGREEGREGEKLRRQGEELTSNGMIPLVLRTNSTVAVTVEAGHGGLGEEGKGLFEDCNYGRY